MFINVNHEMGRAKQCFPFDFCFLQYHPDVSKDLQAGEMFKSIRCAYEVVAPVTPLLHHTCAHSHISPPPPLCILTSVSKYIVIVVKY